MSDIDFGIPDAWRMHACERCGKKYPFTPKHFGWTYRRGAPDGTMTPWCTACRGLYNAALRVYHHDDTRISMEKGHRAETRKNYRKRKARAVRSTKAVVDLADHLYGSGSHG